MNLKNFFTPQKQKFEQQRQALNEQFKDMLAHTLPDEDLADLETDIYAGIRAYLSTPLPDLTTPLIELPMVAVDFETTGLDANRNKLLSVGCVNMLGNQIKLAQRYHQVIDVEQQLEHDNVCIHQITEQESQQGESLELVVNDLLLKLAGKVMLVHFNKIERHFLTKACLHLYGIKPPFVMVDTLLLANQSLRKKGFIIEPRDLTLKNLRQRFYLPNHTAHNALGDAIATAELYLAMMSQRDLTSLTLKDVI
ncbi:exonuclease domain-containing protein [Psychrosphaera haliotis]|nr:exonuclease domain-containing protein [Psychrosphaera haliotis]